MKIRVLGPIEVEDGGERASLSPQLRRLLGVLVAADGRPVSADRLAMDVADGRAEGSTVRTAVSRLRKIVGARIEAADGGYRLVVGDELDLIRFHDLRRRADGAEGDQQVQLLREALALWRGPAFGDHRDEEWAAVTAAAAEQAHAACVEALAEALVECGDHAAAVTLGKNRL